MNTESNGVSDLQARVKASLASMREDIVRTIAEGERHLRAVDEVIHDRAGWYGIVQAEQLAAMGYPVPITELQYPVPAECPSWHEAEVAANGSLFRFFAREAWLTLPQSFAGAGSIVVRVPYAVNGAAMDALSVEVDGVQTQAEAHRDYEDGTLIITLAFADLPPGSVLRFRCAESQVPAQIYPDNTDTRRLSAAIQRPEWLPA